MDPAVTDLFIRNSGIATTEQLRAVATVGELRRLVSTGAIRRVWHGAYSWEPPTTAIRLRALSATLGTDVAGCLGSAASLFGFDVQGTADLHVLDPAERHIRSRAGLSVHQRLGAPIVEAEPRTFVTAPAWTAVELARILPPARALATLDAALATKTCTPTDLVDAADRQATRAGIVDARRMVALADGRSGSPMESETRLVLLEGGLIAPELQWPVFDEFGFARFFLDFAWPDHLLAVEYDGDEHHSSPQDVRRDKLRASWLGDHGWTVLQVVVDDVRRHPDALCARVRRHLRPRTLGDHGQKD